MKKKARNSTYTSSSFSRRAGQDQGARPTGWKRPFVETASANRVPFAQTITKTIEFPEKDESVGELQINFLGPAPNAFLERNVG